MVSTLPVPGRTRWALFDRASDRFFVNIADPPLIVAINPGNLSHIAHSYPVPAKGPHGLDLDPEQGRLFCACDEGKLITFDSASGKPLAETGLSGPPDVISFNPSLRHLYVAVGNPGVIDVLDTEEMRRLDSQAAERGAHTLAFDARKNKVYAFLPETHRAAVYQDSHERRE
jgi:DNA-binding beta-propeller fold protein YncE